MNTRYRVTTVPALLASAMLSTVPGLARSALAHDDYATPGTGFVSEDLGFPELRISYTEAGLDLPDKVPSGRTLVVYENAGESSRHAFLFRLPDAISADQALADLGPEAMEPPAWFFDAHFPGFVGETVPGATSQAVVDLEPGTYGIADDELTLFEVVPSDATPATMAGPEPVAMIRLIEMGFDIPAGLTTGRQIWEVRNDLEVPHELMLAWSSAPITPDEVLALIEGDDQTATPAGNGSIETEPAGGLSWLSPGAVAWTEVDLKPGSYGVLCFVFDPETGMPHAMMGMYNLFEVS